MLHYRAVRTFTIIAFGCKVSQYEAAQFAAALTRLGLSPAPPGESADLCLVQACAVTALAERKSRRAVRAATGRAHRVVVTGCWPGDEGPSASNLSRRSQAEAIRVLSEWVRREQAARGTVDDGPGHAVRTTQAAGLGLLENEGWISPLPHDASHGQRPATSPSSTIRTGEHPVKPNLPADFDLGLHTSSPDEAPPPLADFPGRTRPILNIQDGCDAHCAFCIVPTYRPTVQSRPAADIVAEARSLVAAGFREVVLAGIFLGAFGRATAIRRRWDERSGSDAPLLSLLDELVGIDRLARIRLSSIEPGDVSDELLVRMTRHPAIVPHLHLPLQSGSDHILARMNRQYDRGQFDDAVRRARAALDRPALTADVLVGFPGETDDDFEATLEAVRLAGLAKVHAFPFSPRPGTTAATRQAEFVPPAVIRQRMARLTALADELSLAYRRSFVGQVERVIIEWPTTDRGLRRGRVDRYFMVQFPLPPSGADPARRLAHVRIETVEPGRTVGRLISIDD